MIRLNIHEAKTHLSSHLESLCNGEEDQIILCKRNVPVAEIRAIRTPETELRPIGLAQGSFRIPPSFFDPLPVEFIAAFSGES